ncbi:cell division control protein 42 homolog [Hyalella azteca]|uniref:Cell division control protein 42 homolog n=1 Tax=Hyalella azteca TaxID=294128 RepID=A0A8B7NNI2_HYAAZ|nr:cell division control protein 42 homolog [Hyalella azteca]
MDKGPGSSTMTRKTICPATGKDMKVNVVGDGAVGKNCLLTTYIVGVFPEEYVPIVFEQYKHEEIIGDTTYVITYWVSAGQEDYDRLRPLSYPQTSVFILCFSLDSPSSFENISAKWIPEVRAHSDKTPIILVGTKKDLRGTKGLSSELGENLCRKKGLLQYLECSALTQEGLKEVFEAAALAAAAPNPLEFKKSSGACCFM